MICFQVGARVRVDPALHIPPLHIKIRLSTMICFQVGARVRVVRGEQPSKGLPGDLCRHRTRPPAMMLQ